MSKKRYGPVGSNYNSKKYLAMHNKNISEGLKHHYERKRKTKDIEKMSEKEEAIVIYILIAILVAYIIYHITT